MLGLGSWGLRGLEVLGLGFGFEAYICGAEYPNQAATWRQCQNADVIVGVVYRCCLSCQYNCADLQ